MCDSLLTLNDMNDSYYIAASADLMFFCAFHTFMRCVLLLAVIIVLCV